MRPRDPDVFVSTKFSLTRHFVGAVERKINKQKRSRCCIHSGLIPRLEGNVSSASLSVSVGQLVKIENYPHSEPKFAQRAYHSLTQPSADQTYRNSNGHTFVKFGMFLHILSESDPVFQLLGWKRNAPKISFLETNRSSKVVLKAGGEVI